MSEKLANWNGNVRTDNAVVVQAADGNYVVTGFMGAWTINTCPCCLLPFNTPRNAKLVADSLYPVQYDRGDRVSGGIA